MIGNKKKALAGTENLSSIAFLKEDASNTTQDGRLYNEILDAILDHRLSPGVKLKEDDLASIFSVSRTIVRRALLRLSHDRIVDIKENKKKLKNI